ncbi:Phage protein (ACLAME 203) [hydrothermal vent metagenome]|uniref:Phage protein (ACLAME 203) n=1 Tax=hydrothermal vent metagenome TaxID=652676 RepID=A0A3B0W6Y2_9ZZZZ
MAKYRKKPVEIEATQWFKNGDHPKDNCKDFMTMASAPDMFQGEGEVVRYYRTTELDGQDKCKHCDKIMHLHGWTDTLEGGHIVCPGDFIITGIAGEMYPCKPDIFDKTYEHVLDS